jgi:hypothetical protein
MRRTAPVLFAAAAVLLGAQSALACELYTDHVFMSMPTDGWALGVGGELDHVKGSNGFEVGADVSIKLGSKAVIRPGVGLCRFAGSSKPVFGGGVGLNLWNSTDGKIMLNGQSGLSFSRKSGVTDIHVPVLGVLHYASSETLGLFGGAGIEYERSSTSLGSGSDTNPLLSGGFIAGLGSMDFIGAVAFTLGSVTETSVSAGLSFPMSE